MKKWIAAIAAGAVMVGCQITIPSIKVDPVVIGSTTTTTTTTTTTQPPTSTPNYTKDFNWADAEKDNSTYCGSVEIRCLVNDNLMTGNAWITGLSQHEGGMTLIANADGSVTCTGKDFTTENNKYHFEGWKIKTDQSKMITDSVVTLKGGDKGGTTRGYWRTVK